jgi:lipopolysaccharide transport system ATP-binding protein
MSGPAAGGAIRVEHVSKVYRVFASPAERLKRLIGRRGRYLDFAALHDVSFRVAPGEAVGLIGENGAGKSTLLKIVAGTTAPTSGTVEVEGKVASILELGAAFHPEFTGRENAVLYGALLGLERDEVEERLERILAFAELGDFIDHPVKSYSTGMAMRLAFAVATHLDPEVLVIDEALAVGDGYFQKKCIDRLLEIKASGTTILFCSHSMFYVTSFCDRALWLKQGRLERDGSAQEVVPEYEEFLLARGRRNLREGEAEQAPSTQAVVRSIRVLDPDGHETRSYIPGRGLTVEVEWETLEGDDAYHVGVALERRDGSRIFGAATFWEDVPPVRGSGVHTARITIESFPVAQGVYSVSAFLFDESGLHIYDQAVLTDHLEPAEPGWKAGLLELPHRWEV